MKYHQFIEEVLLLVVLFIIMADYRVEGVLYPWAPRGTGGRPSDAKLWSHYTRYKHIKIYDDGRNNQCSIYGHCIKCNAKKGSHQSRINHLADQCEGIYIFLFVYSIDW